MSDRTSGAGSSGPPQISFIIPVLNAAATLGRCLDSIRQSAAEMPIEVIVIDNGSTDGSLEIGQARGARTIQVPAGRLGRLRNTGARLAAADLLAFVDADHELDRNWVSAAIGAMKETHIAAVGSDCLPPPQPTWVQRTYDGFRRHGSGRRDVEWLGSGNLVVRRSAFLEVGGFDERLETCEDVDLCRRLRGAGHRLIADDALRNVHYGDPRTLKQVFAGERWRGRDNVRVSFRAPLNWRTMTSALIPLASLVGAAGLATGVVAQSNSAPLLAGGAAAMLAPVALRTVRTRGAFGSVRTLLQAGAVAAAYEGGRALALTTRTGHATRRART